MDQNEVFANLKAAFEEAVSFVQRNDVQLDQNEGRRSELIDLVILEASQRNN